MLFKLNQLRIKDKLMLLMTIFFLFSIIVYSGIVEISKASHFQRLEREQLASLDNSLLIGIKLSKIKNPKNSSSEIATLLDKTAKYALDKGLVQNLKDTKEIVYKLGNVSNSLEKYLLGLAGFKDLFELISYNDGDISMIIKLVEDYRNKDITYQDFVDRLIDSCEIMREDQDIFAKEVNSVAHFISIFILILLTVVIISVLLISFFIYKGVTRTLKNAKNNIHSFSLEIQSNSKNQIEAVSVQNVSIEEINQVMQNLVSASRQISEISSNATIVSKDSIAAVEQGLLSLEQSLEGIRKIKENTSLTVKNMHDLEKSSEEIEIVFDVINELSKQVTVLSYNATIEAAGAGEEGKRFMAVADRIIKLAESSVKSGKAIKGIIDKIQVDSKRTIKAIEETNQSVEEGMDSSIKVKESLDRIEDFARKLLSFVDEIDLSSRQQLNGVEQAAIAIEDVTVQAEKTKTSSDIVLKTADALFDMAIKVERI